MSGSVPVILDCDPGHDDAIAILLAVGSPGIDLRAVTTTFGNCSVDDATRNALRVLTLAGASTSRWRAARRLRSAARSTSAATCTASAVWTPHLPEPQAEPVDLTATELVRGVLGSSTEPVTIVATGPTTNVARLFCDHPEATQSVREVVFMGGSTGRGNHTPAAEFNALADPEALDVVLSAGVPVRMVGLNVTHRPWPHRRSSTGGQHDVERLRVGMGVELGGRRVVPTPGRTAHEDDLADRLRGLRVVAQQPTDVGDRSGGHDGDRLGRGAEDVSDQLGRRLVHRLGLRLREIGAVQTADAFDGAAQLNLAAERRRRAPPRRASRLQPA